VADIASRVESLDQSLFDFVEAQLGPEDRRSLLALHTAWREAYRTFAYLEIGSHLGGSLQALVRDPACDAIVSIDLRPAAQPDERGQVYEYEANSTARMLDGLGRIPGADLVKLTTVDASTDALQPTQMAVRPKACLVDGEHTDAAALRDARFCRALVGDEGCIAFHDSQVVYRGLARFLGELERDGVEHRSYFLPNTIFVVELGPSRLIETPQLAHEVLSNAPAFLVCLLANDHYRRWYVRSLRTRTLELRRAALRRLGSARRNRARES
jgi:hypothetical protein